MNRDNMERWIEALESDEYQELQCRTSLERPSLDGRQLYCALGIGLLKMRGVVRVTDVEVDCNEPYEALAQWLGFHSPDEIRVDGSDGTSRPVWELNDEGMTFPEIAQLLRKQYL